MERPKRYNFTEALQKLRRYCAYQERCQQEVKQKLWDWGYGLEDGGQVIVQLIEEGFLNEERYAKAVAGGKFRQKSWGRRKIEQALKQKGVGDYLRHTAMKEIPDNEYRQTLKNLLEKKYKLLKGDSPIVIRQKMARYALQKGYESELIWELVYEIAP